MTQATTSRPRTEVSPMAGPRVHLRAPTDADAAARLALGQDAGILRAYGVDTAQIAPLTQESAQAWLDEQRAAMAWMITVSGQLIGTIRLHSLVQADRRAQIAIGLLDPDRIGQGLGTEAMRLVIDHAFDGLGLHRLGLRVLVDNETAIATYENLGFVQEGRQRQSARVANGWQDDIMMGLLADDWVAA